MSLGARISLNPLLAVPYVVELALYGTGDVIELIATGHAYTHELCTQER